MTDNNEASKDPRLGHRESKWAEHILNWQMSGQSQSAYCKEHDLKYALFNQAVKRQRKSGEPEESGFIEVKSPVHISGDRWRLEISFPNGLQLQTIGHLPEPHLIAIIKELRG